jgi:WXG100 family type VII secretion target
VARLWREVVAMAAEGRFRVDLEALAGSATQVSGHGEDLASAHLSSDNRIAAAQSGWVGDSAAALHIRTASWLETSRRLLTRVGDHALDLNNDGIYFAATERDNVEKSHAVDNRTF